MGSFLGLAGLLLLLLVIWAALLFGGYLFGKPAARGERRMPAWTRLASSLVLMLAAWGWFAFSRSSTWATFTLLIAIGMSLGFVGDLFMAGLIPLGNHVLGGLGAFGLGHVAYITAGLQLGETLGLTAPASRLLGWLAWLSIGALGWYFVVFRGQRPGALHWAALPYSLLLATTAGVATGLALQESRLIPLALGAALFLLSDLMIAAKLFAGRSTRWIAMDDLIWLTYGPGQMLIVYTAGIALLSLIL